MNRPLTLTRGRYTARFAGSGADLVSAQRLRHACFRQSASDSAGLDRDAFDAACTHVLIEDRASGQLVCCFRLLRLASGDEIGQSYSAQFYDLSGLASISDPIAEVGRFCMHPDWRDPDVLRLAWGVITSLVDEEGIELLFGCSSFRGTDAVPYADAFALLRDRHLAPMRWRPRIKAPKVVEFSTLDRQTPDLRQALSGLPPLLRSYLLMGGWVSDHAVVDPDLQTLHVFTGLEIRAVPPARARLLRALSE